MVRSVLGFGLLALLFVRATGTTSAQSAAMSEDAGRMHERLLALSQGDGSLSELRIEFMDANGLSSHRSFNLQSGTLVSKEWSSPGAAMVQREGTVSDARIVALLEKLIAIRYWTFQGTRFVPDAPVFLFRFYYGDLAYVDFRCDAGEFRQSDERSAIRDAFLQFVDETEMQTIPSK